MWDAAVDVVVDGSVEFVLLVFGPAPTEQVDVGDRSIEALVERRDS